MSSAGLGALEIPGQDGKQRWVDRDYSVFMFFALQHEDPLALQVDIVVLQPHEFPAPQAGAQAHTNEGHIARPLVAKNAGVRAFIPGAKPARRRLANLVDEASNSARSRDGGAERMVSLSRKLL